MATSKIKKGDLVRVITGKDKGHEGKVLSVKDGKVVVEGAHMVQKHTKASQSNPNGGIVTEEAPMDISNVMYVHKGKPVRIGFTEKDGKKVRIAKPSGDVVD